MFGVNEIYMDQHTSEEENPFDFTWDDEGSLVVTGDNYVALTNSIHLVACAINRISEIGGADNMKEYLEKAHKEMLDNKYVMEIELDKQRKGIA